MTTYTELFAKKVLLSRTYYAAPGETDIIAPPNASFVRVSMVGGGGKENSNGAGGGSPGGQGAGAAFARVVAPCDPGDAFRVQVGAPQTNSAAGDSVFTRTAGSVILARADRARINTPGSVANSVGTVRRAGQAGGLLGGYAYGGAAAGDDQDPYPLGFGGRGATQTQDRRAFRAPVPGGGGMRILTYASAGAGYYNYRDFPAGGGRVCVEFFDSDPGY